MDVMDDAPHRLRYSQDGLVNVLAFDHNAHRHNFIKGFFILGRSKGFVAGRQFMLREQIRFV